MLKTPLGNIVILVSNVETMYAAIALEKDDVLFPDVDARYKITIPFEQQSGVESIKCLLVGAPVDGDIESGERIEAISFYYEEMKLTIGTEWDFGIYNDEYDYSGGYLPNGIEYCPDRYTQDRDFIFGVSWIDPCTEDNDAQTWFGADAGIM